MQLLIAKVYAEDNAIFDFRYKVQIFVIVPRIHLTWCYSDVLRTCHGINLLVCCSVLGYL